MASEAICLVVQNVGWQAAGQTDWKMNWHAALQAICPVIWEAACQMMYHSAWEAAYQAGQGRLPEC